ncbi:MAG: MAPEG family protein, partial [Ramlibacter sp.]
MKTELWYLALSAALTGLLWVPYILDRVMVWGLMDSVGYPDKPKPQSPWAQRLMRAHANSVENLVVFAALV